MGAGNKQVAFIPDGDRMALMTPYDPAFLAEMKAHVPASDRLWDAGRRVWLIDPASFAVVAGLMQKHFNAHVQPPLGYRTKVETTIVEIRYLGVCKNRSDGSRTSYGWSDGGWKIIIPEPALRLWFEGITVVSDTTLYGLLGLRHNANAEDIRSAYRRMAKQWHPDICHEPNAAEIFRRIQDAYDVLRDDQKRARYDVGLQLQASLPATSAPDTEYRAPLRCGLVMVRGQKHVAGFVVDEILAWSDIVDEQGRVLVSSWPAGAEMFEERWQ